jgi:ADP-L-glycero-D-manno-heptose 6-epimerase
MGFSPMSSHGKFVPIARFFVRVLVTGGAGFIGSNLAKKLAADGHDTTIADDFSSGHFNNLTAFPGDVVTLDLFENLSPLARRGPFEVIFHEASITDTTVMDQRKMMQNNVEAFRNLLELAAGWGSRIVWASSCSIYGQGEVPMKESQPPQPLNVYAYSKLAMERLAKQYHSKVGSPIAGLRYSNVYGPGEAHKGKFASMIHQLAKQMRAGKRPRIFTPGTQRRDFVYIDDIISANLCALQSNSSGIFNGGVGNAWSFNEVVTQLNRVLKTNLQPDYFENPYSFTQDWTQTDLSDSTKKIGYVPQFDLVKGIDAYHASGTLGI